MGNTAWFRNNPYDPAYIRAEDAELWARVDPATPCKLIKDPLLFYREPLAPHLDKYRSSCRSMRNIFRHYGRQRLGVAKTCVAVLDSFAKEMLYTACALGGFAAWLIRRRNRSCNEQELRIANHVLSELAGRTLSPAQLHFK
jgi:hypothetical protein